MEETKEEIINERKKLELELTKLKELNKEKEELAKIKSEVRKYKNQGILKAGATGKKALEGFGKVGWKVAGVLKQGAINMNNNYQAMEEESKKKNDNQFQEDNFKF